MNIQFLENKWVFGNHLEVEHFSNLINYIVAYVHKPTGHILVKIREVKVLFGMDSPNITYVNIETDETVLVSDVENGVDYAPVFHFNAIVSNRFIVFADGSNALSSDTYRQTERVYTAEESGVECHPSIMLQTFCNRDIDALEAEFVRIKQKYNQIYFLTKSEIILQDFHFDPQVIR